MTLFACSRSQRKNIFPGSFQLSRSLRVVCLFICLGHYVPGGTKSGYNAPADSVCGCSFRRFPGDVGSFELLFH